MVPAAERRWPTVIALLFISALGIGLAAYFRPFPVPADSALLASDAEVRVDQVGRDLVFSPKGEGPSLGLLFLPEERVPPEAYAYLGRALASAGYLVVLLRPPLNSPRLALGGPAAVQKKHPDIGAWVLGGHGAGGATAARWARSADPPVAGLLLLAAAPDPGLDLSGAGFPVLLLSATEDDPARRAGSDADPRLLPPAARRVEIVGGNHAQFGDYGAQPGDGVPALPAESQRRAAVAEIIALMESAARP